MAQDDRGISGEERSDEKQSEETHEGFKRQ
jgi:hypothetical protein